MIATTRTIDQPDTLRRFALPLAVALALNIVVLALVRLPVLTHAVRYTAERIAVTLRAPQRRPAEKSAITPAPPPATVRAIPVSKSHAAPTQPVAVNSNKGTAPHTSSGSQERQEFRQRLEHSVQAVIDEQARAGRHGRLLDGVPAVPKAYRHIRQRHQLSPMAGDSGYRMSVFHGQCYAQAAGPLMFANYPHAMRHMMAQPHQVRCPWDNVEEPFHFKKHAFGTLNSGGLS